MRRVRPWFRGRFLPRIAGGSGDVFRDPAYWPFSTFSPWNYPIGSNAKYDATNCFGTGINFVTQQAKSSIPNIYFPSGFPPFGSGQPQGTYVMIGRDASQDGGSVTDPVTNLISTDGNLDPAIYSSTKFPRHMPTSQPFNGLTGGEWEGIFITPDHLTCSQMYDPSYNASGAQGAGFYPGSLGFFPDFVANIDLKGPGVWAGASIWPPSDANGNIAVAINTGDEATPYPSSNPANGTAISGGFAYGAAGVAYLGGLVRSGELQKGIPHALQFWADSDTLVNGNGPAGSPGMVWPSGRSTGWNPNTTTSKLYNGGLIAIPPSVNLAGHTFNTTEGKNIAYALQRYGMYVMDGGATGVGQFRIDLFHQDQLPDQSAGSAFTNDMLWTGLQLAVVTNSYNPTNGGPPRNGYKIDGGDGTLLAPLAPPFGSKWGGGNGRYS